MTTSRKTSEYSLEAASNEYHNISFHEGITKKIKMILLKKAIYLEIC